MPSPTNSSDSATWPTWPTRIVALLLGGVALWGIKWLLYGSSPDEIQERVEIVKGIVTILAPFGVAYGFWLSWRRAQAMDKQADNAALQAETAAEQAATAARQADTAAQGQATQRFTEAIKQLGTDKAGTPKGLTVRLGGIYALEKLAEEKPKQYHSTVMKVLCSFVRENSQVEGDIPADVQAIMTVIGKVESARRLDLRKANLRKANLREANLSEADLSGAELSGAELWGANLSKANLSKANLSGAELWSSNLSGAIFIEANLSGASLRGADLGGAIFIEANLSGAELSGAELSGAALSGADLNEADLRGADLSKAEGLTQGQIASAQGDANTTKLPDLTRPEHWAAWRGIP